MCKLHVWKIGGNLSAIGYANVYIATSRHEIFKGLGPVVHGVDFLLDNVFRGLLRDTFKGWL